MPLPPGQPLSQRLCVVVHRPQPSGRLLLEVLGELPPELAALAGGTELHARLQLRIGRMMPLIISVPVIGLPDAQETP